MKSHAGFCPRSDLLGQDEKSRVLRAGVKKLKRYVTFDHIFKNARTEDPKMWHLKAAPLRREEELEIEEYMRFTNVLQKPVHGRKANEALKKLKKESYSQAVEVIFQSLPIPEAFLHRNVLEKAIPEQNTRLKSLVEAQTSKIAGSESVSSIGPSALKKV